MDIQKLQKAVEIMNSGGESGSVHAYHDELQIYPNADSFSKEQVEELDRLGFLETDDGGWFCFT